MKKIFLFVTILIASNIAFSQLTFSVSPSVLKSSAAFGYKIGNFNPYAGISSNSFSINSDFTNEYSGFANDGSPIVLTEKTEVKGLIGVYLPEIGAKYFIPFDNNVKAFINLSLVKPILYYNYEFENTPDPSTLIAPDLTPEPEITNELSLLGTKLGFGAEYFFNNSFSIGGEFGLSSYNVNFNNKTTSFRSEFDGTITSTTDEYDVNARYTQTYSKITINFYLSREKNIEEATIE